MDLINFELESGIPVKIIDNFYTDDELKLIWEELDFFTYSDKLQPPEGTATAQNPDGTSRKQNRSLFLDTVWSNQRNLSNILKVNRKIFENEMALIKDSPSWFFKNLLCDRDTTLISYYENTDHYKPHRDAVNVTVLTWFFKEPKRFSGGDLILYSADENSERRVIEVCNNRVVIFPGSTLHEVSKISIDPMYQNQKLGRYCMSQFLSFTP